MSFSTDTLAIVGVGLLGGSIGLAARRSNLARQVVGIGRNAGRLEQARARGAIDRGTMDLAAGSAEADWTVVCTPVDLVADIARRIAAAAPRGATITDVGSTKAAILARIRAAGPLPQEIGFVGSHPLAGGHETGVDAAREDLFEGRVVIVTVEEDDDPAPARRVGQFWEALGARVIEMTAAAHDQAVAATSHLPHLVAAALAAATDLQHADLVASGWSDTTRIAAGDVEMWRQILTQNRGNVLKSLDNFETLLASLRKALADDDQQALVQLLRAGKEHRDALGS